jgi:hypothetical protein
MLSPELEKGDFPHMRQQLLPLSPPKTGSPISSIARKESTYYHKTKTGFLALHLHLEKWKEK